MTKAEVRNAIDEVMSVGHREMRDEVNALIDQPPPTPAVLDVEGIRAKRGYNSCITDNRCHAEADHKLLDDIIDGKYTVPAQPDQQGEWSIEGNLLKKGGVPQAQLDYCGSTQQSEILTALNGVGKESEE